MSYRLDTMEQYAILRWLTRQGIAPVELTALGPLALQAKMADGSMTLYRNEGGKITAHDIDPVC